MRKALTTLLAFALVACGGEAAVMEPTSLAPTPETSLAPVVENAQPVPPISVTVSDDATNDVRTITVGGMGSAYAEPDHSVLSLGISCRRDTVLASGRAVASAASAMTDALLAEGVLPEQIQTSEFSIYPWYDDYPYLAGYETYIGYRVTLTSVNTAGSVLAAAMEAGGDDVRAWGIRFEADPHDLIGPAREQAWADVQSRAEALAGLAGEPLGEMLDAHEKVLVSSSEGMAQGGEGDSASFDIPVAPGVAGVVVLLTVTFAVGE